MQHHAANELHIEMTLSERALGGLADHGERFVKHRIQRLAVSDPLLELSRLGAQVVVAERRVLRLERVDLGDAPQHLLDLAVIAGAENFPQVEHAGL